MKLIIPAVFISLLIIVFIAVFILPPPYTLTKTLKIPINYFGLISLKIPEEKIERALTPKFNPNLKDFSGNNIAIYVKGLEKNFVYEQNTKQSFNAASLYKIPLAIGTMFKIESGEINLNTTYKYYEEDLEEGTSFLLTETDKENFDIRTLLFFMLNKSDNISKNILLRNLGKEVVNEAALKCGISPSVHLQNNITAEAAGTYFECLYSNKALSETNSKLLLDFMTNTYFENRLTNKLPFGTVVAHKIGSWFDPASYHDCGIVFAKDPYVICVLTQGLDGQTAEEVIGEISKEVYESTPKTPHPDTIIP